MASASGSGWLTRRNLRPRDIAEDGLEFPLLSQDSYTVKARSVAIFVGK